MPYFNVGKRTLFYREQGSGPALIFLPGNTASSACHVQEISILSKDFHVACLDFYGTGQSGREHDWQLDWWQQGGHDAISLADELKEEQVILLGCSGGGAAALWATIRYPHRVKALILDSMVPFLAPAKIHAQIDTRRHANEQTKAFWQMAHGSDWQQVVDNDTALMAKLADAGGFFFSGELTSVQCPLLVCGCLDDELLADDIGQMVDMVRQVPAAKLFLVNGGGHPSMWTLPADFFSAASTFLTALDG